MGLLRRAGDLMTANLHEWLDRLERPETMLQQAIREMQAGLADAMRRASGVLAAERLLSRESAEKTREMQYLEKKAEAAIDAGEDSKARELIGRRLDCETAAMQSAELYAVAADAVETLRERIELLRRKIAEARRLSWGLETRRVLGAFAEPPFGEHGCWRLEKVRDGLEFLTARWKAESELATEFFEECERSREEDRQAQIGAVLESLRARRNESRRSQGD